MLPRDRLLTPKEVCERLGICRATLWNWSRKEGPAAEADPKYRRMPGFPYAIELSSRAIRFRLSEIEDWIAQQGAAAK